MIKLEGMHFYINIDNFDDVVDEEESRTGKINHSIHALNTFFSAIERYGLDNYRKVFFVEKITGARLHMYVISDVISAFNVVKDIAVYAFELTKYFNSKIAKYKTLLKFEIQIGAAYGEFYDFVFKDGEFEEETTIGFAANYAAKLQILSKPGALSVSDSVYSKIKDKEAGVFTKSQSPKIKKYGESCYYTVPLQMLVSNNMEEHDKALVNANEIAKKVNLTDITYEDARVLIDPKNLSVDNVKKVIGIPLFADVRDFTSQFDNGDKNLAEMAKKTQDILLCMYKIVEKNCGVHIQFQGDREFALYHDYGNQKCVVNAVNAAMRIIDGIHKFRVCVGIGESLGRVFVSRIGARGEKDNIVLGRIVAEADRFEDDYAGENELVISENIYKVLQEEKPQLARLFEKNKNGVYITRVGYEEFVGIVEKARLEKNNRSRNYNGAWQNEE